MKSYQFAIYLYSRLKLSSLVVLSFEYLSFSNKQKITILFPSPLTFLQWPMEDALPCARQSIDLFAKKNSFRFNTKIETSPTDFIFGLVQSCQYDRTTTINTPFKFLPTFPQKIYGAADTAKEVDMQLKFTFFFTVISRSFFHRKPNGRPMNNMKKIKRQGQETQHMPRGRFLRGRYPTLFFLKDPALFVVKLP